MHRSSASVSRSVCAMRPMSFTPMRKASMRLAAAGSHSSTIASEFWEVVVLRILAMSALLLVPMAQAAEGDPCSRFAWNVTNELAVMKQAPQVVDAGAKAVAAPSLAPGRLYELKLSPQGAVTFAATPAKPTLPDGTHGGLAKFHLDTAGRYRISITS